MLITSYVFTFFISLYPLLYYLNLYQKQYYDFRRFIKLFFQKFTLNYGKILIFILFSVASFISIKNNSLNVIRYLLILVFSFMLYYIKIDDKIIPFKITTRVKRFIIGYTFLYALFVFFSLLIRVNFYHIPYLYFYFFPLTYVISCYVNFLIEKLVIKKYIKQAKNKLQKCKKLTIIGISGSYGKTSTKNYIYHLISKSYSTLTTDKSYNTFNGILKTINEKLNPSYKLLLLELGIDKINGMNKFIDFFNFDIATLTAIGSQHLSTFKSIDNIEKEKMKLLTSLKKNNIAIINLDEKRIEKNQKNLKCKIITISATKKADIYATHINCLLEKTVFNLNIFNKTYKVTTQTTGKHHITNILIAIAIAKQLNISDEIIVKRLQTLSNPNNRLKITHHEKWTILDDSYNSNYIGFINALNTLNLANSKKVIITPGLIELNKDNTNKNSEIADKIYEIADIILLVSDNAKTIYNYLINKNNNRKIILYFELYKEAINYLKHNYEDKNITILIENDLPESYLK